MADRLLDRVLRNGLSSLANVLAFNKISQIQKWNLNNGMSDFSEWRISSRNLAPI
jgi:hypothetical protein